MTIKTRLLSLLGLGSDPTPTMPITPWGERKFEELYEFLSRIKADYHDYREIGHEDFVRLHETALIYAQKLPLIEDAEALIASFKEQFKDANEEAVILKDEWQVEEQNNRVLHGLVSDADEVIEHLASILGKHGITITEPTILMKASEAIRRRLSKDGSGRTDAMQAKPDAMFAGSRQADPDTSTGAKQVAAAVLVSGVVETGV